MENFVLANEPFAKLHKFLKLKFLLYWYDIILNKIKYNTFTVANEKSKLKNLFKW